MLLIFPPNASILTGRVTDASPRTLDLYAAAPGLKNVLGEYVQKYQAQFQQAVRSGCGGAQASATYAAALDGLLGAVFSAALAAARSHGAEGAENFALVAVGSYGRKLIGLHSDLDIILLCSGSADALASIAEAMLYPLWDTGLRIGHSVRSLEESIDLVSSDLPTATSALDARFLTGDAQLVEDWRSRARQELLGVSHDDFVNLLETSTLERHAQYGGTPFLLEPDIKMASGGLRDVDLIHWLLQARWGEVPHVPPARAALLSDELQKLHEAHDFLICVRNAMHARAGRQHDRVTFSDQEDLATDFGFSDEDTLGVERFMRSYYIHARFIRGLQQRLFERARTRIVSTSEEGRELAENVVQLGGALTLSDFSVLERDPALSLRLYSCAVSQGHLVSSAARDAIFQFAADPAWASKLRGSEEATRLFLRLLTFAADVPFRSNSPFSELHDIGLLNAMVPEFEPVTALAQHNLFHIYTVDIHTLAAIDRLRALERGDLAEELPLASAIAIDMPRPVPLYLSVLCHDIGKHFGKEHPEKGAEIARTVCNRLVLSAPDTEHVMWLVRHHLDFYRFAVRRDTADPRTIREIVRSVGSSDRLRDLFLLTIVDVGATNPTALTAWKVKLLDDLYRGVSNELRSQRQQRTFARPRVLAEQIRSKIIDDAEGAAFESFVSVMPERYLLANPAHRLLEHALLSDQREEGQLCTSLTQSQAEDILEFAVSADDKPGLLADCCGVLAAQGWIIEAAQVYTFVRDGQREAFNIFHIRRRGTHESDVPNEEHDEALRWQLDAVIRGECSAGALVETLNERPSWSVCRAPAVKTEVRFDNGLAPDWTVVDVFTKDKPGLLYTIARALLSAGLTIALSKVSTEGARAMDVFYVSKVAGGKIEDCDELQQLTQTIRRALDDDDT